MGKVTLVGAGPGDPGLLTVKGLEALRHCDCVVYDRLASPELLDEVPQDAKRIYVGKQAGAHYRPQEEINQILVEAASTYHNVVRLKGGDSFVYGRGMEEILVLEAHGHDWQLVPGITSAISVLESEAIPITHRGMARSFHVFTGHIKDGSGLPDYDYEAITKLDGTLVFLMALKHCEHICTSLLQAGMNPQMPAAMIQSGTMQSSRKVVGTVSTIAQLAKDENIQSPAIFVIGKTVQFTKLQKERKKVGIVCTDVLWDKLGPKIEALGQTPIRIGRLAVQENVEEIERMHQKLQPGWLVFTSINGVDVFMKSYQERRKDIRGFAKMKIAAIGHGTSERLASYGLYPDYMPNTYSIEALTEGLLKRIQNDEIIFLPRAKQGNPSITKAFDDQGISYEEFHTYDVQGDVDSTHVQDLDTLIFTSSSGVLCASELQLSKHTKIISIGSATQRCVQAQLHRSSLCATKSTSEGIIDLIQKEDVE